MIDSNLILSESNTPSKSSENKDVRIFDQLHSAQQEINNLRLLNVCLQSTLLRVQTQLIDYLPNDIKRNEIKQKLANIRHNDDQTRRIIHPQQLAFFENFKNFFEKKQEQQQQQQIQPISIIKNEKQIDILYEMFHELNTLIHTEHNDRICQLYITLAQTSQSVIQTRDLLDKTIHTHKIITKKRLKRKLIFIISGFLFVSFLIFFISISIRKYSSNFLSKISS